MTPQERQLVSELFDRLQQVEMQPRDAEAERLIAQEGQRAPHALYALVQTVLLQDEALRAAHERIQQLEQQAEPNQYQSGQGGSFLDSMRGALFGHPEEPRSSVPSVRPGATPSGLPSWRQSGAQTYDVPNEGQRSQGPSFLGTAAASAAGVIGGALLLDSFRSMFGGGTRHGALSEQSGGGSPWDSGGSAAGSDLSRQAGLDDIGRGGYGGQESQRAGLFDNADDDNSDSDSGDDSDFDSGFDSDIDFA